MEGAETIVAFAVEWGASDSRPHWGEPARLQHVGGVNNTFTLHAESWKYTFIFVPAWLDRSEVLRVSARQKSYKRFRRRTRRFTCSFTDICFYPNASFAVCVKAWTKATPELWWIIKTWFISSESDLSRLQTEQADDVVLVIDAFPDLTLLYVCFERPRTNYTLGRSNHL